MPTISTAHAGRWSRELGSGRVPASCASRDGERRPDVRSLAIARETLAYHRGLADFAFAMQGLGSGAISLFGTDRAEARMAAAGRQRRGDRRLRHDRAGMRVGRRQHRDVAPMRDGNEWVLDRRKDLHLQRRHRRLLPDLRAHRRRRRRARAFRLHRAGRSPG